MFWLLHFLDSAGKICSVWVWYPDTWTKTLFYRGLVFFYFLCSRLTVPSLPLSACDVVRCWGSVTPCRENTNLRSWWRSLLTWPRGTNRTLLTSSLRWDLCLARRKGHMTRVSYFGTVIGLKQKELRLFIKNDLGLFWLLSATVTRPSTLGLVSPGVGCRGDGGSLHRLTTCVRVCCRSVRLWRTTLVNGKFYSLNSKVFFFFLLPPWNAAALRISATRNVHCCWVFPSVGMN